MKLVSPSTLTKKFFFAGHWEGGWAPLVYASVPGMFSRFGTTVNPTQSRPRLAGRHRDVILRATTQRRHAATVSTCLHIAYVCN